MDLGWEYLIQKFRSLGVKPTVVSIILTIAVSVLVYFFPIPFGEMFPIIGVVFSLLTGSISLFDFYQTGKLEHDNERFGEALKSVEREREASDERDEAQADLLEYQRMVRILEDRNVDLAKLIDNQTEASQIALLVFRDQDAPENHDYYQAEEKKHQNKFIRYRTKEEYDGETVSSFTWMLPPSVVAEEGLENATRDELKQWFRENVYDYYDDEEFQANVLLMGLMDVSSIFSITKEETKLGKFAENLIEYDDEFTEADFYEALAEERVNMLEEVKAGRLAFFLPDSLDKDTMDRIRSKSEVVKSGLKDGG